MNVFWKHHFFFIKKMLATKHTLFPVNQYLFETKETTLMRTCYLSQVWLHTSQRIQLECQEQTFQRLRGDIFLCVQRGWNVLQRAGNQVSWYFFLGMFCAFYIREQRLREYKGILVFICLSVCLSLCLSNFHGWYLKETSEAHILNKSCLWHADMTWLWLKVTLSSTITAFIDKGLVEEISSVLTTLDFSVETNDSFLLLAKGQIFCCMIKKCFLLLYNLVIFMSVVVLGWDWARGERQEEHRWPNLDLSSNTEKWMRER